MDAHCYASSLNSHSRACGYVSGASDSTEQSVVAKLLAESRYVVVFIHFLSLLCYIIASLTEEEKTLVTAR